jgi:hypothetical protein
MKIATLIMVVICTNGCIDQDHPDSYKTEQSVEQIYGQPSVVDTTFTQTIIRHKSDGTYEFIEKTITLAQELAENEAREMRGAGFLVAEPNAQDPSCAGTSEWLYDQPGFVGNRICFSHPNFNCELHDLSLFTRTHVSCPLLPFPEPLPWARGDGPGAGACVVSDPVNVNRVRSIWTGSSGQPGVWFFDDNSLGGTLRSSYTGTFIKYPDISTPGRYIWTCGSPLH